jgi:hypothetical protein
MTVDLESVHRVRTVFYTVTNFCERPFITDPLDCECTLGSDLLVGNSKDNWENETCGSVTEYGGSRTCDLNGRYAGLSKIIDYERFFICCVPEFGVYTT